VAQYYFEGWVLSPGLTIHATIDTVYWLITAAQQTIAALVAVLVTGYSIFIAVQQTGKVEDEEQAEINRIYRERTFRKLGIVIVASLLAIVFDFVFIAGCDIITNELIRLSFFVGSIVVNVASIVLVVLFSMYIVSPYPHKNVAVELLEKAIGFSRSERVGQDVAEKDARLYGKYGKPVSRAQFIEKYIALENLIKSAAFARLPANDNRRQPPLRALVYELQKLELINQDEAGIFGTVTKYRNLAVHGELESVPMSAYNQLVHLVRDLTDRLADSASP